jgi:hypothetical protein
MLLCFVFSPYLLLLHCKCLFILLCIPFQVHAFLFSYKAPITSFLPAAPILPSPLHSPNLLGWPYLLTSKWEAEGSSQMSVPVYQATWHHSQEDGNLSYFKHWSCYTNQEDNNRSSQPLKQCVQHLRFWNQANTKSNFLIIINIWSKIL